MRETKAMTTALILAVGALCGMTPAYAQEHKAYALIVSGEGDEPNFSENYKDWVTRLYQVLTAGCGFPANHVSVLTEKKDLVASVQAEVSTKENVLKALKMLAEKVQPGDQCLIFLVGHGTAQNKTAKLCLPGPDLSSDDVADALNRFKAREVALINTACGSDTFLERCSLPGRTLITATNNPNEGNETYFMEFLLKAFENKAGDANKDGAVTLLEAFNQAAVECPKWYLRQYYVDEANAWRVDGKESRKLWEKFYGKIKEKALAPSEQPDTGDAEPQLGEWGTHWEGRRMPTEHAQLDDNGDRLGTAVFANNEFAPLKGAKEEEDGGHARQINPGKPRGDKKPPSAPIEPKP